MTKQDGFFGMWRKDVWVAVLKTWVFTKIELCSIKISKKWWKKQMHDLVFKGASVQDVCHLVVALQTATNWRTLDCRTFSSQESKSGICNSGYQESATFGCISAPTHLNQNTELPPWHVSKFWQDLFINNLFASGTL